MGIIEFRMLLKSYKDIRNRLFDGRINKNEYITESKKHKYKLSISISYLVVILCQLGYVIYNWDEVNI